MYKHFASLLMLIPLPLAENFKKILNIIAKYLDMVRDYLRSMIAEFFPLTADKSIAMWEEELGIIDPADTLAERQQEAYIRHKGDGASTLTDLETIIAGLGMTGTVQRHLPFQASESRAGDACWGADWLLRLDIEIDPPATADQLEKLRRRINEILPADIIGGIVYEDQYITWR